MNLRDLQYVVADADHGHFGRAAAACNISQPTLSGQILKLEDELGVRIFEREGRTVAVAARAEPIVEHARHALAGAAEDRRHPNCRPLSAALRAAGVDPRPAAGAHRNRRRPRLLSLVLERKIDAAVIATDPGDRKLEILPLYEEPFLFVAAPGHPLAARDRVAPDDIDPEALLLLADGHCLRDQAIALYGHGGGGRAAGSDISATSLETLFQLAAAGYGVTLAPQLAIETRGGAVAGLVARPLADRTMKRDVTLAFRRDSSRRAALTRFVASVRAATPVLLREAKPAAAPVRAKAKAARRRRKA